MNFKKTAIALAVAIVAATPMAASADGGMYASAHIGLQYMDEIKNKKPEMAGEIIVRSYGSLLGLKGETDIGNGWSGWANMNLESILKTEVHILLIIIRIGRLLV